MAAANNQKTSRFIWSVLPWCAFLFIVLLIILLTIKISSEKEKQAAKNQAMSEKVLPAVNIVTQRIIPTTLTDKLDLPAMVTAWEDLLVSAEVTGQIISVAVAEGQQVSKGQILVEIDPRDYQSRLLSIQAQYELATTTVNRLISLKSSDAISQDQLDQASARKKELSAALVNAELLLERCTIKAPLTGVVNYLPAKTGLLLSHGDPVAQILQIDKVKVEVAIPEADVTAVRTVEKAAVIFTSLDNLKVTGTKIFLASQPASSAMVYPLRLAVENPNGHILPGMFARAEIIKHVYQNGISIPIFAVISQNDKKFVFTVQNGLAHKRPVKTGIFEGWQIQITHGLQTGDEVVIVGHRSLEDGQPVTILKTVTDPGEINR